MPAVENWDDLLFWRSGEWQVIEEHIDDVEKSGRLLVPRRENLFLALDLVDLNKVKVVIMGQDPYPDLRYATGVAFSIPELEIFFPPTLKTILKEYQDDLHYDSPTCGDLTHWLEGGVLLWNAYPSLVRGERQWIEWEALTQEILTVLSGRGIVFVFLGAVAKGFSKFITSDGAKVLHYAHPSPRNHFNRRISNPFLGSRMFTTINAKLCELGREPIDWRLE